MNLDQIPLLALIKGKLGYDNQRQQLISENVANADTPGFAPSDLKQFTADKVLKPQMTMAAVSASVTNAAHIAPQAKATMTWKTETAPDSESTIDGNQVALEDQMLKMSNARMDFDTAITLYQQSLGLLKMAARRPGG